MSTVPAGVQVGVQGTHLIRASINPTGRPQGRVLTQPTSGGVVASSVASSTAGNNPSSVHVTQAGVGQSPQVSQMQQSGSGGQILATVQCPRPQTATLVYSNHAQGQPFGTAGTAAGQRLTLSHSRPIRPIQLTATNNRITGTGLRAANISIRPPNVVPGLTSTNVLTATLPGQGQTQVTQQGQQGLSQQQQQQRTGPGGGILTTGPGGSLSVVGTGAGAGTGNLATRIIQVQAPQSGGGAQVINTGRIAGNLMTLTPVLSQVGASGNVTTGGGVVGRGGVTGGTVVGGGGQLGSQMGGGGTGKVQSSLTITQFGKITAQQGGTTVQQQQQQGQQLGQGPGQSGGTGGSHIVVSQAPQQQHQTMIVTMGGNQVGMGVPLTTTASTLGHHQMMNVVSSVSSSGGTTLVSNAPVSGTTTMLPLSGITTTVGGRVPGTTGIVRTLTSQGTLSSGGVSGGGTTTLLPLAKVIPQSGGGAGGSSISGTGQTVVETQLQQAQQAGSIFIHSRSPNPVQGEKDRE